MDPNRLTEKAQDAIRQAQALAQRHADAVPDASGGSALSYPIEPRTLAGVLDGLSRRGFADHLTVVAEGLRVVGHKRTFPPDQVSIAEHHRFEGMSDPDDMAILYAIEVGSGIRGTLVDAFGVYADPLVGEFLRDVPLVR